MHSPLNELDDQNFTLLKPNVDFIMFEKLMVKFRLSWEITIFQKNKGNFSVYMN